MTVARRALPCLALLALACDGPVADVTATNPPTMPPPQVSPPPDAAPPDGGLESAMTDHFGAIREIQVGVVRGLLDHVKERGVWLAGHLQAPGYEDRTVELAVLHAEATTLAAANDLARAARQAARLGGACGSCHVASRAAVELVHDELPRPTTTLAARMRRHGWASDRMWEGLVAPSKDLWRLGAQTLVDAPLIEDPRLDVMPRAAEVKALALRVRRLARAAVAGRDAARRVEIYGELLATCSSCHTIAWPIVRAK